MSFMKDHLVDSAISIRGAMARLNQVKVKLCVVVDEDGRLVRTVTDGDIRRALLQGQTLDDRLDRLPFPAPIAFKAGTDEGVLIKALQENGIIALVIVDEDNRPVQVVSSADLH